MNSSAISRQSGKVVIIDVAGRISLDEGLGAMRAAIKDAVEAGHRNILLNLEGVEYIDSAGLGEMASAYITVNNMGGKIKLVNARDRLNSMLRVTKLYTLLTTYSDEETAIASF
jgi:anti-sigma B factor antagonist